MTRDPHHGDDTRLGDELAGLVGSLAVRDEVLDRPSVRAAARAVVEEITMTSTLTPDTDTDLSDGRRPHRRVRPLVAAAIALVAVGVLTAAAVGIIKARTGDHVEPGATTEDPGGGELIRLDAPDAPEVLVELARPIPVPPGTDLDEFVAPFLVEGFQTDVALQSGFASRAATCEWPRYWLDAQARGDAEAQAEAQAVLDAVPTWPWITDDDGGFRRVADGLRAGDTAPALEMMEANC
jgi:hypothetical protein